MGATSVLLAAALTLLVGICSASADEPLAVSGSSRTSSQVSAVAGAPESGTETAKVSSHAADAVKPSDPESVAAGDRNETMRRVLMLLMVSKAGHLPDGGFTRSDAD
jgi:hypothetical protein